MTGGGTSSFSVLADGTSDVTGTPFSGQTLILQSNANLSINPGTNSGTIELSPGSTLSVSGTLTNEGTIQIDAGSGTAGISGGTVNSSGAIVDNGTLAISSTTWTNSGPLTVSSTGTFDENGTFTNAAGGTIANSGTFEVGGGEHFTENGGTTSGSPVLINDAFLNFTGGGTSSFSVIADGTTDVSGAPYAGQSLTLQTSAAAGITPGSTPNLGTIEFSPGSNLSLTGTLTNAGTIQSDAGSGTSGISGGTVNSSGAIVDNGTFAISSTTWTNSGPLTVSSTGTFDENGTFTNAAGGTIANSGTFEVGGGEHFTENGGTTSGSPVLINDAFLNFTGGGTSSFSVIADGTTDVSGAPYAGQSLTLQTSAAAGITPGSTPNLGTIDLEPASTLSLTGTLTNDGTIDSQVNASNGTTISGGSLVNSGNVILETGNTTRDTGTYTQTSGGILTVDLGAATGFGNLAISGAASLTGTLAVNTNFTPTIGSSFTVTSSGGLSTTFSGTVYQGYANYSVQYASNDVNLVVVAGQASASTSTVTASPSSVTANGTSTSTVTATLLDASGNAIAGKSVSLLSSSPFTTITTVNGTTNSAGQATFTVSDTVAEGVTLTANDVSDGILLDQTAQVTFTPGPVSATTSTTTASPSTVVADGIDSSDITVTLLDAEGNPVPGQAVSLSQGGGASVISDDGSGVTNADGQVVFTVTDLVEQDVTYTPSVIGVSGLQSAQVEFVPGAASSLVSTLVASPISVTDNGTDSSTITATVEDENGNPISDQVVSLTQGSGHSTITAISATTNAEGQATFSAVDSTSEVVTYSATDTSQSNC